MKIIKYSYALLWMLLGSLLLVGCGGSIEVVDAGTYQATVDKAVPAEEEIYVTLDSGQTLELYFTDATELVTDGEPVDFSQLSSGSSVEITVEREGNRNIPTRVEIMP